MDAFSQSLLREQLRKDRASELAQEQALRREMATMSQQESAANRLQNKLLADRERVGLSADLPATIAASVLQDTLGALRTPDGSLVSYRRLSLGRTSLGPALTLYRVVDSAKLIAPVRRFLQLVAAGGTLVVIGVLGVAILAGEQLTRPIRVIQDSMWRLARGEPGTAPEVSTNDEIEDLARELEIAEPPQGAAIERDHDVGRVRELSRWDQQVEPRELAVVRRHHEWFRERRDRGDAMPAQDVMQGEHRAERVAVGVDVTRKRDLHTAPDRAGRVSERSRDRHRDPRDPRDRRDPRREVSSASSSESVR